MTKPIGMLKPELPLIEPAIDSEDVRAQYRYWQNRILISTIIGYALFYFVRKNLSMAMPEMEKSLGISKTDLGLFLTLHGLLYGVSRFINGMLCDRTNARWFMAIGLACSAVINLCFGFSSAVITFGLFWMLNGWVQGMGFPPCCRLMTHWFPPRTLATKMSIWNSSHSIGAALVFVLCGYLIRWGFDWRYCFFVPAGLALCGAAFLAITLRDTPESLGLPEVEGTEARPADLEEPPQSFGKVLVELVFSNPYIWLISLANFFVYVVRYGIVDWGPTFLKEAKHIELAHAGWMVAAFEVTGILGMLASGWVTDKIFGGRGTRTCLVYMTLCFMAMLVFWQLDFIFEILRAVSGGYFVSLLDYWQLGSNSILINSAILCTAGFFIYGPQCLIGIAAANMATKRAAASAAGLTGIFGYASTAVSGVGMGAVVDRYGWNAGFMMLAGAAAIGIVLFALCWPARADGYKQTS